jgi:hypothetical protein
MMDDDFSIVSHKSTSSSPEIGHYPHCTQIGNFILFVSIFTLNVLWKKIKCAHLLFNRNYSAILATLQTTSYALGV